MCLTQPIECITNHMPSMTRTVGYVGLGNMGSQMALNLANYARDQDWPPIQVWNRSPEKSDPFRGHGHAVVSDSIQSLVEACDIVHMALANDEVASSVVRSIIGVNKKGLILADHSTLFPTTSTNLQAECAQEGIIFCSCPVFGPPAAAKSAQLLVAISGDAQACAILKEYVVPSIGKAVIECGERVAKGALMKIIGNNCILGTIELLSESFTLAEKTGLDADLFYDFISKSAQPPPYIYSI